MKALLVVDPGGAPCRCLWCRTAAGTPTTLATAEHERLRDAPACEPARRTARHTGTIRHTRPRESYARAVSREDVEVRRSRRRRRTVSAYRDGGRTVVLIPASFSAAEEDRWVERMLARLTAGE